MDNGLKKNDFIGKSALKKIQKSAKRKLVCIKMQREGHTAEWISHICEGFTCGERH